MIPPAPNYEGAQRLSIEALHQWEQLRYGMFLHFGMSTFDGDELSMGDAPSTRYAPSGLDVDQWIRVARDAGMKYAVLTAKHVAGHCLWPSVHTDYHVGTSANTTDVVGAFVDACRKYGVMPGLYYCTWDNHHTFGSHTPSHTQEWDKAMAGQSIETLAFVTWEYLEFQTAQITELLTHYGPIGEVWIDIPNLLPRYARQDLYHLIASLQPQAVVMMNNGIGDGSHYPVAKAWPADLIAIERFLPNSQTGHVPWREIEGKNYYMPGEVCDPIGKEWFYQDKDQPRSDAELLGMVLTSVSRGCNLLLNVPPDRSGRIPRRFEEALFRLHKNINLLNLT